MDASIPVALQLLSACLGFRLFPSRLRYLSGNVEFGAEVETHHELSYLEYGCAFSLLFVDGAKQLCFQLAEPFRVQSREKPHRVLAFPPAEWVFQPEEG
jgi:hypothetical protein